MASTTTERPVRQDGHTEGCNGSGVVGFDVKGVFVKKAGRLTYQRRIVRYHYCAVPLLQHYPTTIEGTDPCL